MTVVALVPAKDRGDSVGATVAALSGLAAVDEVLVVDDGSADATAQVALAAGARVLRLPVNAGKGAAVRAGVAATPEAEVYLLVDADLGATAAAAADLLDAVLGDRADLAVGVLPPAGRRGGLGGVRRLAGAGIRRATGGRLAPRAPLSGQRAVRAEVLRALEPAHGFGLETAMTIDAVRRGARVVELDVAMDHRHTGRSLAGFRHRAGQGADVVRALWPRLTDPARRVGAIAVCLALAAGALLWAGGAWEPTSLEAAQRPGKVVLFGAPKLGWDDVGTGAMPTLDRLVRDGAVAATSVRTLAGRPSTAEGYATLGAGTRVRADELAGYAFGADEPLEGATAAEAVARRTGRGPRGEVVVVGAPSVQRLNDGRHLSSGPGALGDALRRAGRRTAVVGNADIAGAPLPRRPVLLRPAASALMDRAGSVDAGAVGADLLTGDARAPFGLRADRGAVVTAVEAALAAADVVLVDPGDMDRAAEFAAVATPAAAAERRRQALAGTDRLLAEVARLAGPDALLLVVSVAPPTRDWHLTPMVAAGPGVRPGYLHSRSTRRLGVVTLTDVAPTVLDALGVPVPEGMIGQPLRFHPGAADLGRLREIDRDAAFREALYSKLTIAAILALAGVELLALVALAGLGGPGRPATALRWAALGVAAWPVATFLLRAVPDVAVLGPAAVPLLVAIDAAVVALALRSRCRPLAPLAWICGGTVAVLVADLALGGHLQTSSLLGYSYHTAARFTGLGNTAFGVLAASAVVAAALHVHHAPRRGEALVTAAGVLGIVVLAAGAPSLGSDVGGILTLVPVFGLTLLALGGRRVSWRAALAVAAVTAVLLAVATAVDLARPPGARTHLGSLAAQVRDRGWDPLGTTLARKAAANLRSFRSPWAWVVPVVGLYLLALVAWARGWSRLLPPRSAVRAAVVGVLAAAALGYAVNDSGVVVSGLALLPLGPFLSLVALDRRADHAPVLLDPPASAARGPQPGGQALGRRLAAGT